MKINANVKNVIFDLGKVLIPVDFQRTTQAFSKLAGISAETIYNYHTQIDVFDKLERGEITNEVFRNALRKQIGNHSSQQIDNAWNAMLYQIDLSVLNYAHQLRAKYKTYILSNTNAIHIGKVNQILQSQHGVQNLNPFFDKVYYSHNIGARKPEPKAYKFVLNENKLIPHETVFIDDKQENLDAAEKLGLQVILKTDDLTLKQIFS